MNAPDIWFTLYALAKKGAIHRGVNLTTRELGETLNISQQTASRRILFCFEQGLVSRSHTANGMVIHLTEKGRKELVQVSHGLEVAFAPPEDEIIIEGQVVEGLGEGAYYVDMYASRIQESMGFVPYSGTLNVRVTDDNSNKAINRMKQTTPLIVKGFSHESRTFGDVICYRIKVNQAVEGVIVIAQRTHHSQNILEVIAPINLRKKLRLNRGDNVTLTVVPLHLVT
ncbi:MAG: CTP-dependent riboflavin kinase [Candidatus Thorarchaeota archaeon]|nr:MAG: CTP-dependent riboflavin kinase [Candidatus Thorarchaeota archaeon]